MLKIRDEQFNAFDDVAEAAFRRKLAAIILERHGHCQVKLPDRVLTAAELKREELEQMIKVGLERATGYGLTFESSLASFVILMFETAPNFDAHPLVGRILRDEKIEPNLRTKKLLNEITDQNWGAVRKQYDPRAW